MLTERITIGARLPRPSIFLMPFPNQEDNNLVGFLIKPLLLEEA